MLSNVTTQIQLQSVLEDLVADGDLPSGTKIDVYAGQIDVIRLSVDAGKFPAILINWQGDAIPETVNIEPDEAMNFTLLICTDSGTGLTEGMGIVDNLNDSLLDKWNDDNGDFMFHILRSGPAKPLFNLKRKQVIAYPVKLTQ